MAAAAAEAAAEAEAEAEVVEVGAGATEAAPALAEDLGLTGGCDANDRRTQTSHSKKQEMRLDEI